MKVPARRAKKQKVKEQNEKKDNDKCHRAHGNFSFQVAKMNEISEENSFVSTTLTEVTEGGHISVLSVTMSHCLTNEKNVFIYALFDIFPVFLLIKAFHLKIKVTFLVIYKVHTIKVYKECNFLQFLKVLSIAVASKWNL